MVSKLPTDLMSVLPWVTGMVLAAILPLLFTRIVNQQSEHQEATHVWPMLKLRQARLGLLRDLGIVLGSLYGLMPLYLNHQGVSDSGIGFWMAVMVSAGIVGQWPIGRLADRFGRLLILRVQVFVVIMGCMAMLSNAAMAPALFILGQQVLPVSGCNGVGLRKSRAPPTGCHESGITVELYHRKSAWPNVNSDVDAELFRQFAVYYDCQRVVYLSSDAAAKWGSIHSCGARLKQKSPVFTGLFLIHNLVAVLLKDAFHAFHCLFLRRFHAIELVLFTHRHPFMFTQFVIGQQFDFFYVAHIAGKLTKTMSRFVII
jgi:hypothetical protein